MTRPINEPRATDYDEFEQVCDGCRTRLCVRVARRAGGDALQSYQCPACDTLLICLGIADPDVRVTLGSSKSSPPSGRAAPPGKA